jgi:hypothetical protein
MRNVIGFVVLSVLLLSAGCSNSHQPTAPSTVERVLTLPTPIEPACVFAAVTQRGRVYAFSHARFPNPASYTRCSRFVLYDNGSFELQFGGRGTYSGTYRILGNVVDFTWDGWSVAGSWGSNATLDDNTLDVRYNTIMMLSDFEDAVYELSN